MMMFPIDAVETLGLKFSKAAKAGLTPTVYSAFLKYFAKGQHQTIDFRLSLLHGRTLSPLSRLSTIIEGCRDGAVVRAPTNGARVRFPDPVSYVG